MSKRIIIAGGGTGGHIFPAIAIANALRHAQPDTQLLFVGAKGKMEMEKVPKEGYKIIGLDIAGMNRSAWWKNISLPIKLVRSFLQAAAVINDFKPDMVVGVGGYASFPVLFQAQRKGIPTLIQEQNSFAGKSNKIIGRKANLICVAYEGMEKFFPKEKIRVTGNPVRKNISVSTIDKTQAASFFHLDPTRKIVFVFGGSLGARSINEAMRTQFKDLLADGVQVIWQTGTSYFVKAKEAVQGFEKQIKVFDFIQEMNMAYAAADIIVSRAGASSIAELCIVGKPVIFIPFPYASEDHQTHNAQALVKQDAAAMVKDADAQKILISEVKKLLHDTELQRRFSIHSKQLAITDADQRIANLILNQLNA
jgi:UDP-N-acetylglucosamine--N-acetylmuramyl-(pentapeptide) pyrophosphoryl-undecaprenol N-acetylglucosamine transferase